MTVGIVLVERATASRCFHRYHWICSQEIDRVESAQQRVQEKENSVIGKNMYGIGNKQREPGGSYKGESLQQSTNKLLAQVCLLCARLYFILECPICFHSLVMLPYASQCQV